MKAESKHVYAAIAAVAAEMAALGIAKGKTASTGGGGSYKFRGIDDVYNALAPVLSKHGLVIIPRVMDREVVERQSSKEKALFYTTLLMEFDFVSAEDGSMHTARTVGEAMDSGDKSCNKAMSAAYKYAAFQTFCIPLEGGAVDSERDTHEVVPHNPPPKMLTAKDIASFVAAINAATTVDDLKARFTTAYGCANGAGDAEALRQFIAAKDARKLDLDAFAPDNKRVAA